MKRRYQHRPPAKPSRKAVRAYLRMMGATDAQIDGRPSEQRAEVAIGGDAQPSLLVAPIHKE